MSKEEVREIFEKHYRTKRVAVPHDIRKTIERYEWKRIPELKYPLPILPDLEYIRDNRVWLGGVLDAEGTVIKTFRHYDKVDGAYRYEYLYPCVEFVHTHKKLLKSSEGLLMKNIG